MQEPIAYHIRRREQPKIRELEPEHREQQAQRCDSRQSGSKLASIYQPIYFDAHIRPTRGQIGSTKGEVHGKQGEQGVHCHRCGPFKGKEDEVKEKRQDERSRRRELYGSLVVAAHPVSPDQRHHSEADAGNHAANGRYRLVRRLVEEARPDNHGPHRGEKGRHYPERFLARKPRSRGGNHEHKGRHGNEQARPNPNTLAAAHHANNGNQPAREEGKVVPRQEESEPYRLLPVPLHVPCKILNHAVVPPQGRSPRFGARPLPHPIVAQTGKNVGGVATAHLGRCENSHIMIRPARPSAPSITAMR